MINPKELSSKYEVRKLTADYIPEIYDLCIGNPQFYEHCPPAVSEESILKDMQIFPDRVTKEDKYYIGFFEGNTLVAVLDLITRFPNPQTAFFGFFMMNKSYQGKGTASALIEEICENLSKQFSAVRLGFVKTNQQSEHFWRKNGFLDTGIENKEEKYTVVVLERKL